MLRCIIKTSNTPTNSSFPHINNTKTDKAIHNNTTLSVYILYLNFTLL